MEAAKNPTKRIVTRTTAATTFVLLIQTLLLLFTN